MAEVFDFGLQQHKIKMDGKFFENNLFAVAGDTGRRLEVQLLDSNNMVQNTTGISLRLNANVAGQTTYAEATLVDAAKGLYELDLPNGMLIAPGNWQFQWQIIGTSGEKLHSFAFTGSVGSNLSEGGSEATNFYLNADELKQMQEDLVNGTIDSSILETKITEKLTDLETQYAPKLTEVTAQLAHKVNVSDVANLSSGTPIFVNSIGEMVDSTKPHVNLSNGIVYLYNSDTQEFENTGIQYQSTGIPDYTITYEKIARTKPNLLVGNKIAHGKYITSSGSIASHTNFSHTDYISVIPGKQYDVYTGDTEDGVHDYAGFFYDQNKNYLGYFGDAAGANRLLEVTSINAVITIPENVHFVRLNLSENKSDLWYFKSSEQTGTIRWLDVATENLEKGSVTLEKFGDDVFDYLKNPSKWVGKKANFLGDSITFGYGLTNPESEVYHALLQNALGLSLVRNYGISGTKIAKTSPTDETAMSVRYEGMADDADLVVVLGGTNDYGHHSAVSSTTAPFGNFSDRTAETFYGALHVLYSGLLEKYPTKTILVVTPLPRTYAMNNTTQDDRTVNPDTDKNMLDYVNAIREIAEYYSIPILDLYKNYGITPLMPEARTLYMPDCLHPNELGHTLIANKLETYLNNIV